MEPQVQQLPPGKWCKECRALISVDARRCMHCGAATGVTLGQVIGAAAILLVGFAIVAILVASWF